MNPNMQLIIDMLIFQLEDLVYNKKKNFLEILIICYDIGNNTAVRLFGDHRLHDYINANEIKV
jgi:hypothetical protein